LKRAVLLFVLLLPVSVASAAQSTFKDRVGDVYEIRLESVSESVGGASRGSSSDNSTLFERVAALASNSVELEFDLPPSTSAEARARSWQFPVSVLKPSGGPFRLLNPEELESRVRTWLAANGMTEAACGRWVFTWTAVKIECDPQSVLQMLEPFDFRPGELREGALYSEPGAIAKVPLRTTPSADGESFVAEMNIDPEMVRRSRAAADVAVAEMTGQPSLTLDAALSAHASERVSGTIVSTITMDPSGRVVRRSWVTKMHIVTPRGEFDSKTTTTAVRRLVPATN
jgi:hypothetical protein